MGRLDAESEAMEKWEKAISNVSILLPTKCRAGPRSSQPTFTQTPRPGEKTAQCLRNLLSVPCDLTAAASGFTCAGPSLPPPSRATRKSYSLNTREVNSLS